MQRILLTSLFIHFCHANPMIDSIDECIEEQPITEYFGPEIRRGNNKFSHKYQLAKNPVTNKHRIKEIEVCEGRNTLHRIQITLGVLKKKETEWEENVKLDWFGEKGKNERC